MRQSPKPHGSLLPPMHPPQVFMRQSLYSPGKMTLHQYTSATAQRVCARQQVLQWGGGRDGTRAGAGGGEGGEFRV